MKPDVFRQVAALHSTGINQGFLATLGIPFLALMYRAIDEAADSVLLVEEIDGRILGFVSGGNGMGPIYRRMLGHPLRLGWSLLPVLFKPRALVRVFEVLRYGRGGPTAGSYPDAELLSIVVAPEMRGSDVAQSLYRRLAKHFRAQGVVAFRITVGEALVPAQRFYSKMGAKPIGTHEVHAGKPSIIYVHDVAAGSEWPDAAEAQGTPQ